MDNTQIVRMANPADEPRHPIAVASERTGLSQDVLRVWERRYSAVAPTRGPGGQRLYSDSDIERLRLMHVTTRAGRGVAQIAAMSTPELARMAAEDAAHARADDSSLAADALAASLEHAKALDAVLLSRELRRAATALGLSEFLGGVAAPFMRRIGDDWHAGHVSIAQEHLASTVLRDLLIDMMRGFFNYAGPRVVVATPAGERHEIGAAIVGASAAADGWNVVYLGADLPAVDIIAAARGTNAEVVALSVVYAGEHARVLEEIRAVREKLPRDVRVIVGGAGAREMASSLRELGVLFMDGLAPLR